MEWYRYADVQAFLQRCNEAHPTMKFTGNCSSDEVHFLDTAIYKGTNFQTRQTLDIKTYTKPTNKQAYLHGSSFHPFGIAKSIALVETYRFLRSQYRRSKQTEKLEWALLLRGYRKEVIKPLIRRMHFKDRHRRKKKLTHLVRHSYRSHTTRTSPKSAKN